MIMKFFVTKALTHLDLSDCGIAGFLTERTLLIANPDYSDGEQPPRKLETTNSWNAEMAASPLYGSLKHLDLSGNNLTGTNALPLPQLYKVSFANNVDFDRLPDKWITDLKT